ncbi:MAG: GNAT family N-acetyltransferase [bacterium]|nr:GNAT family N-acetyltransferase [bacterium]
MSEDRAITIRPLRAFDDMHAVVDLQRTYWGTNLESVIPAHMLFSLANYGGHVLTAFDGAKPIGVLVGFLGTSMDAPERPAMANLQIVSKRMVVLPEYRGHGIGYRLKLAQRDLALRQGIRLVVWTFDPLLALNAHLNIRKLGAVCPEYLVDPYGTRAEGGLAALGSSDRLQVEWWVTNRRVEERIGGNRAALTLAQYLQANTAILNPPDVTADGAVVPTAVIRQPQTALALIEIPVNYAPLITGNPDLAVAWRKHTRTVFLNALAQGFVVTDFLRENHEGRERAFYLLSYTNGRQSDSFSVN